MTTDPSPTTFRSRSFALYAARRSSTCMSHSVDRVIGDTSAGEGMRKLLGLAVDATWIAFSVIIVVVVIGLMLGYGDRL